MIYRFAKRYMAFTVVGVGIALITALRRGYPLTVAALSAFLLLALAAAIFGRKDRPSDARERGTRAPGKPYSETYRWEVNRPPSLEAILEALNREDMNFKLTGRSSNKILLKGGSQIRARILGAYLMNLKFLSTKVELKTVDTPDGLGCTVEVDVRDNFGVAIRDEALHDRFVEAADGIQKIIGVYLEAMGGVEVDSAPPSFA